MNYSKVVWVSGAVVVASILDLVYMFWSRSNPGHNFHKAGWHASSLGKGRYDVMKIGKVFHR
jgi:hypothetical protein